MEKWEDLVDTYQQTDKKNFIKACECAKTVLNIELAPTEIDWFLDTLLLEPVNLLTTVGKKWNVGNWLDAIEKALKLLANVIMKFPDYSSQHFDNITRLCEKSYDSKTKQSAMNCLACVVKHSEMGARNHRVHISGLENDKKCKAPVAELVGAICEHHPDLVEGQKILIWRVYLKLLEGSNSDNVVRSLMLGIDGVLKSFGRHLPTAEFAVFYKHLVLCRDKHRCKEVYMLLLERHADLFREHLAADVATRLDLWKLLESTDARVTLARRALLAVYKTIRILDKESFRDVIDEEVVHRADSSSPYARYTALRVMHAAGTPAACSYYDARSLEHALRHGGLSYDQAESILWRVECNSENEDRLLRTALVFHQNLPEKYRKQIAVHGLVQAPAVIRTGAVVFLINEMTNHLKHEGNIDKYIVLWKSFFDTENGQDMVVVDKCDRVFSDLLDHLQYTLECFVDEAGKDNEELPEKLRYLLSVSSRIIPLAEGLQTGPLRKRIKYVKTRVVELLVAVREAIPGTRGEVLAATRALLSHGDGGFFDVFADVRIDCCSDDAEQYESCLALALAPLASVPDVASVLNALQIIFSHEDTKASILTRSIKTLENLITTYKAMLNKGDLNRAMTEVEKILQRNNFKDRDGRILRRNALVFLGKYGNGDDPNGIDVVNHRNRYLTLSFPDFAEGIPVKIHLQRLNELALKFEDPDVLQVALDLISANSAGRQLSEEEKEGVLRDAGALLRARSQGRVGVLQSCGDAALRILLRYAAGERRAAARRAVCAVLHGLALRTCTRAFLKEATSFVLEDVPKTAVLDIMEMLLNIVKENNTLVQTHLPDIILRVATIREINSHHVFKFATDLMIDKIELFGDDVIMNITSELLKLLLRSKQNGVTTREMADVREFRGVTKATLDFFKELNKCKGKDVYSVVGDVFEVIKKGGGDPSRFFYILSTVRQVFKFDVELSRRVLLEESFIREKLLVEGEGEIMSCMTVEGILNFTTEYSEVLLETYPEESIKLLSNVLKKLQPEQIVQMNKSVTACLKKYTHILKTTTDLVTSFRSWCGQQAIGNIKKNLQRGSFPTKDIALAASLRILLQVFDITDPGFVDLRENTQNWISSLHMYHSRGFLERSVNNIAYFTDLLQVSLRLMTEAEVMAEVQRDGFAEQFMPALFPYLIRKPYLLMDPDLAARCGLLNNVVKYAVKKCRVEDRCDSVLDLIDQLWPSYDTVSSFKHKHSLLVDIACLPRRLSPDSNPMRWLTETIRSEECTCEMRVKLIGVLPAGEHYKSTWSWFAEQLPARLGEVRGESALLLGALLDALQAADCSLLDNISQLVSGDTAEGWWDEAVQACTQSLAARNDMAVYETIYSRCWDGLSLGVCNRLMVPLLRCSSVSVCEEFFSRKLQQLLELLTKIPRQATAHYSYHKCVVDYTRSFTLLKVVFEVLPEERIKSPNSLLYSRISGRVGENLFHLVKEVGNHCLRLQSNNVVRCVDNSNTKLRNTCLLFHCENYNTLSAATWCRAPTDPKFYEYIFNRDAWTRIADPHAQYDLPITPKWLKRTVNRTVSVALDDSNRLLTRTRTTRTRTGTFRSTLSENPLEFDEGVPLDVQEYRQDVSVADTAMNWHPCAATLTACFSRGSRLPHTQWLRTTADTLSAPLHRNVKWLLAQAICNSEEDLKEYANVLRPALFKMISDTSATDGLLNSLHVDVLDTIIHWRGDANSLPSAAKEDAKVTLERLVTTCIHNGGRRNVLEQLLQILDALLEMYGEEVQIGASCFTECINVKNKDLAKAYYNILKTITKRKIHIPQLLPALLDSWESKQLQQSSRLGSAELGVLFGRAVVAAPHQIRHQAVVRYRKLLRDHYGNRKTYIELIYNAQTEYPELCDREIFEKITDIAFKVVDNKAKCLEILSRQLAQLPSGSEASPEVAALLHAPDLVELVTLGDAAALYLVRSALPLMTKELRTKVVVQSAAHCESANKVRSAAYGVLLRAVQLLFETNDMESNPKRPARFDSPLLRDKELKTPLATLGLGLISDVSGELRDAVSRCFGSTNMVKRFCECFIIAVHLPATHADSTGPTKLSTCLVVLLDLFFKEMRANEAFKRALIRDDLMGGLTTTLRNADGSSLHEISSNQGPVKEEVRSVDEVLEALLQFSKKSPEGASAFCLQIMSALKLRIGCGFDFGATMAGLLVPVLGQVSDLTPFVMEACRLFVDECCSIDGFQEAVEGLMGSVKGTEAQNLLEVLHEDVLVRCPGFSYFSLGKVNWRQDDVDMEEFDDFTLQDMVASFNKLSNWEDLTLQQRRSVESDLPRLWVDIVEYRAELEKWKDMPSNNWFDKMASVYHKKTHKRLKWFREITNWPRSSFSLSATVEALELNRMQDEDDPQDFSCGILPNDCLVQWAARIQTRTACVQAIYEKMEEEQEYSPSPSHALLWCAGANEKALSRQVLRCIDTIDKKDLATLPWLRQELVSKRRLALEANDAHAVATLLERTENVSPSLVQLAPLVDVVGMNHLNLLLRKDVNELSKEKLKYILNDTRERCVADAGGAASGAKRIHGRMVQLAVEHYDSTWDSLTNLEQCNILIDISEVVRLAADMNLDVNQSVLLDVILTRLGDYSGEELTADAAAAVIGTMVSLIHVMDDIALEELTRNQRKLAAHPSLELLNKLAREGVLTVTLKKCFQFVADPKYALHQYCRELLKALKDNDGVLWEQVFTRIREKIFDDEYTGCDYKVLIKHQKTLYSIMEFNADDKDVIKRTLNSLVVETESNPQDLCLSHLCPTLIQKASQRDSATEECLSRLLMLPRGVSLVEFEDKVSFAASVRRPGTLVARLSDGSKRRLLVKCGERLHEDACALRFVRALPLPVSNPPYYQVTPLGEDSGLIEYLEDHVTVLSLVEKHACVTAGVQMTRGGDNELVLKSREDSVADFQQVCANVPAHVLRSVVEQECCDVEEFIRKKRCFEKSLAIMTLVSWLLGLKDRHLGNVMYCRRDGSVRCVDWNPSLQHRRGELPPARLTRAFLALCRLPVLESRLQQLTAACRDSHRLLLSSLRVSYKRFGEAEGDELADVADLLRGAALPHQVSMRARMRAPGRYTGKYVEILRQIFRDFDEREVYTVEEQVTNLLRHCTDPQILGITRSAWEPWI